MPSVCVGCGLTVDGDGKLVVSGATTEAKAALDGVVFPCATTAYPAMTCDDDGVLRQLPDHTTVQGFKPLGATVIDDTPSPCVGGAVYFFEQNSLVITNPSTCRRMIVDITIGGRIRLDIDKDNFDSNIAAFSVETQARYNFNGGPFQLAWNDTFSHEVGTAGDPLTVVGGWANVQVPPQVLAPGGVLTIGTDLQINCSGALVQTRVFWNSPSVRALGHTI